ncbi:MAG: flagellar hook-length control protein FliK [Shinella sp.]|nr:flagellar hook-length control protein FliK [Shinella sp.]
MTSIDNSVLALVTGKQPAAAGKTGHQSPEENDLSGRKGFAKAFASVAGKASKGGEGDMHLGNGQSLTGTLAAADNGHAGTGRLQLSGDLVDDAKATVRDGEGKPGTGATGEYFLKAVAGKGEKTRSGSDPDEKQTEGNAAADPTEAPAADVDQLLTMLAAASGGVDVPLVTSEQVQSRGVIADKTVLDDRKGIQNRTIDTKARTERAAGEASLQVPDASGADASETDQLFRLVRSDGKGREMELSLSGNGERANFREVAPSAVRADGAVTVVESRRYIGLAQPGNASAVTSAIVEDPEWARALASKQALDAPTGKVVNTLKIQMQPIDLGLVNATLRLHGDELVVSLQVETGEAYRQLKDDQESIVKALRGHGFAVDQVSVQLLPTDRSASAGHQQQQGSDQQSQLAGQQQQARGGDGGRQNGEGQQAAAGWGGTGEERTNEQGSADGNSGVGGARSQRSGGVYL